MPRRRADARTPLTEAMRHYLLTGRPTGEPLVPGMTITGKWVGLLKHGDGGDAFVASAWRAHRQELLQAARPGRPVAWYWFDAPPGERWPLGQAEAAVEGEGE